MNDETIYIVDERVEDREDMYSVNRLCTSGLYTACSSNLRGVEESCESLGEDDIRHHYNEFVRRDEYLHRSMVSDLHNMRLDRDRRQLNDIMFSDPNDKKAITPRELLRQNLKRKRGSRAKDM